MDAGDLPQTRWRKSRRSGQNGACAEVARVSDSIAVRDSKAPKAGHLLFATQTWAAFVTNVRDGRYDLS